MEERPKLVGIDADGVLIDTVPAVCALYNEDWGDSLDPADVTAWNFTDFVKPECGPRVYGYFKDARLYEIAEPVPGAVEGWAALQEIPGIRPLIVTSSFDGQEPGKRTALRRMGFLPPIGDDKVAMDMASVGDKSVLDLAVLLDDYPPNFAEVACPGIVFPAPYNRAMELPAGARRLLLDDGQRIPPHAWDLAVRAIRDVVGA